MIASWKLVAPNIYQAEEFSEKLLWQRRTFMRTNSSSGYLLQLSRALQRAPYIQGIAGIALNNPLYSSPWVAAQQAMPFAPSLVSQHGCCWCQSPVSGAGGQRLLRPWLTCSSFSGVWWGELSWLYTGVSGFHLNASSWIYLHDQNMEGMWGRKIAESVLAGILMLNKRSRRR